jgi:DMSO/TMAO reductase YedYZ molybdopterin-dependent catalytic subunit/thiosulfate reductase cytochrome b subunit
MRPLSEAHRAVHYPPDRRFQIWIRSKEALVIVVVILLPFIIAWGQFLFFGLPSVSASLPRALPSEPHGFPAWIRLTHFVNFFFLMLLARSGLSILMDHPRLYWNRNCTPKTDWIRFTSLEVPRDRVWTAKDDARYISPLLALPGYRHTIGMARSWHFLSICVFLLNGFIFVLLLFCTNQWKRLVPTSWNIIPGAWSVFVHYATLHMPPEPNGFYSYNSLQQLAYFAVVFIMAPLSMLTGIAMSPAVVNRFPWYPKLFGGRQAARSIHFLLLIGYLVFLVIHVGLVILTGFVRNMNHIVLGTDNERPLGMILGLIGIGAVVASWAVAHAIAWRYPREIQHLHRLLSLPLIFGIFNRLQPRERYTTKDISPFFWPNGKPPDSSEWKQLANGDFSDYRLKITGLVENPVRLSLQDMRALGKSEQISLHHCIQGWTGVAQWGGLEFKKLVELVKPLPEAKKVVFYSFGEGLYGGPYYDTQDLATVLYSECLLAYEMNSQSLPQVYGAPLRLRVENQLGYKMVKWIKEISFIRSEKELGKGEGGKNEDDEYFDILPNI